VLQPLALGMHREQRRDIPRRELEARIGALLPDVGGEAADAADFLDEVRERSGLLVEVGLDTFAFSHLTFQEYLCAREMVENEAVRGLLLERAGDEWWQEVTLLYVGMAEATPIVEALLAAEDDAACTRLLLAGRCVAEAARVDPATRERVTRRLESKFATCTGEVFLGTGQVLAQIAGEDSVDFFLRLACGDPQRREAALWSLGQMGRQPNQALRERVLRRLWAYLEGDEGWEEAAVAFAHARGEQVIGRLENWLHRGHYPERVLRIATVILQGEREVLSAFANRLSEALGQAEVEIPAGEFVMGDERRRVRTGAFHIARYPVTNLQYWRFVANTGHDPPTHWTGGTYPVEKALHPVVYVSWHDAVAYAEWAGKRLPTEEEWEKTARGTDGREHPWGDWEEGRCNAREAGIGDTTPVGQYSPGGDSPYGCADMAGNVWEWTASPWEPGSARRVLRGGSWSRYRGYARCTYRFRFSPNYSYDDVGFRCVSPVS
jgi:formylglycine-generating enzyme required for sulfatase activity